MNHRDEPIKENPQPVFTSPIDTILSVAAMMALGGAIAIAYRAMYAPSDRASFVIAVIWGLVSILCMGVGGWKPLFGRRNF